MGWINALARVAHAYHEEGRRREGREGRSDSIDDLASRIYPLHPSASARLLLRRYQNARKEGW